MKKILRLAHNCWDIRDVLKTGLLIDGRDYYLAFYHAAKKARRYILISGWQFDSGVTLLRDGDIQDPREDTRFLYFLNGLCAGNPELHIYILAWDFSFIFMLEREWLQEWIFNLSAHERIHFLFDNNHAIGASQHQKFVVIDGWLSFIGGMDICASRWDDRSHKASNPYRADAEDKQYGPYHDIQSYHVGPLALQLTEVFKARWQHLVNGRLELPAPVEDHDLDDGLGFPLHTNRVALSRTQPKTLATMQDSIVEIRNLYLDAIAAAERLIYMENQYFSSCAVYYALVERMRAADKPSLQIVIVLPKRPEALLEEISVGIVQADILRSLRDTASQTGHALGVYYTTASEEAGIERPVYIHSKLLLVDDRFMSVGSANTTNRSLGLDNELNVSWEARSRLDHRLIPSLRRVRTTLLEEHSGARNGESLEGLDRIDGLVERLDRIADTPSGRLRRHKMDTFFDDSDLLKALKPKSLNFDPERPLIEENIYEMISIDKNSLFAEGITLLKKWLLNKSDTPVDSNKSSS